jgi:hypothetical protein
MCRSFACADLPTIEEPVGPCASRLARITIGGMRLPWISRSFTHFRLEHGRPHDSHRECEPEWISKGNVSWVFAWTASPSRQHAAGARLAGNRMLRAIDATRSRRAYMGAGVTRSQLSSEPPPNSGGALYLLKLYAPSGSVCASHAACRASTVLCVLPLCVLLRKSGVSDHCLCMTRRVRVSGDQRQIYSL